MREHKRQQQEEKRRRKSQKLDFTLGWLVRYGLSANNRRDKLDFITNLYFNDRSSRSGDYYISDKEFTHRIAIIIASTGAFGIGIGQLIIELIK